MDKGRKQEGGAWRGEHALVPPYGMTFRGPTAPLLPAAYNDRKQDLPSCTRGDARHTQDRETGVL